MEDNKREQDIIIGHFYSGKLCVLEITEEMKKMFPTIHHNKKIIEDIIYLDRPKYLKDNQNLNYNINFDEYQQKRIKGKYDEKYIPLNIQHKKIPEDNESFKIFN